MIREEMQLNIRTGCWRISP